MDFQFEINGKQFASSERFISGNKLLNLAGFTPEENFDLYKKLTGREYEPIQLEENVDLDEPGIEHFKVFPRKELSFSVDDEIFHTKELELTPLSIFQLIHLSSDQYYLKQIMKHMEITYKNDLDKKIDMLDHPKFITCKKEPTTVS